MVKLNDVSKVRGPESCTVLQDILRVLIFNPNNLGSHKIILNNGHIIRLMFLKYNSSGSVGIEEERGTRIKERSNGYCRS